MLSFINRIVSTFAPSDKEFLPLLEKATANLVLTAKEMVKLVNSDSPTFHKHIAEIQRLEHVGDDCTHQMLTLLSKNFITPFDREDIHTLTKKIDDVVDLLNDNARNTDTYNIQKFDETHKELAKLILASAEALHESMVAMKNRMKMEHIMVLLEKINSIEHQADEILKSNLKKLFETEKDAIKIIKSKSILSTFETATDKCQSAASVIESILIKYS